MTPKTSAMPSLFKYKREIVAVVDQMRQEDS
jgi:hypothetical protein